MKKLARTTVIYNSHNEYAKENTYGKGEFWHL